MAFRESVLRTGQAKKIQATGTRISSAAAVVTAAVVCKINTPVRMIRLQTTPTSWNHRSVGPFSVDGDGSCCTSELACSVEHIVVRLDNKIAPARLSRLWAICTAGSLRGLIRGCCRRPASCLKNWAEYSPRPPGNIQESSQRGGIFFICNFRSVGCCSWSFALGHFLVRPFPLAEALLSRGKPSLTLADKPSLAVLPFAVESDDVQQISLSNGLTEDLITRL